MALMIPRRKTLALAGAAATMGSVPAAVATAPSLPQTVSRICFGSCAHQDKDQTVWDAVLAAKPDLFVFLGDNIYANTRDIQLMRAKYAQLAAKPGFQKLRRSVPIVAVWDDHDYGENDAGADFPMRNPSRDTFLDFWQEPLNSPRRQRDGIYTSYTLGPPGQRVQIILPDLRSNRTPITALDTGGLDYSAWAKSRRAAGLPVPGPYARMTDPKATMLGEPQWAWLQREFETPADVRIFGSSLQVLADFPGWESWMVYARDHDRLIDLVRRKQASNMIFLSGDTHYGELSMQDLNTPYPMWDATSSGLTEVWPTLPPNDRRVGAGVREINFGVADITWRGADTVVTLQIRDVNGAVKLQQIISTRNLTA